ncbi:hypothetical protein CRM22_009369 [Opisthorchis felineus]|uniref:Protein kinase domain-containing protein n=1 Tax=Opisthorchis felineus TaxID=147828 RepID=A0A4V3SD12_OPIFE|nr:hypothetical protein CRM22_009369 [Opisthorchis felineus]
MESEGKASEQDSINSPQDAQGPQSVSSASESASAQNTSDRKDEDEEEEEEEEEDKIVEKSHNSRFHKRNKRFPIQIQGVDSAFVAIEPKSGKEVIWNECILSEKKSEKENRYLSIMKRLKRNSHPFLARYLDAWVAKSDDGSRKLVFITERLDECTLKQFLCNSPKNNRSWKRHVGQLLSVLMFLHRLGIPHGNLTKETIYYQNSGNLRVGPFSLGGPLDQKSQSADVYALGVVALEIAVWTPTEFPQTLLPAELCQQMQARLENSDQRSFIECCLDPNPAVGNRVKRLIHHPAVTEVPILKLLSAKVIVGALRSVTNEEGSATEQTGFASLLKEYVSHYEDETVIVEVHFPHDNIVKSRSWKDFRSNFTLTSKYLEDVKNGFYPLFGCRWNWASYQDEDDDSLVACSATATNGTGGSGWLGRAESGVVPSQACSSGTSTVPSASVSRKHSTATKTSEAVGAAPILMEDEDITGEMQATQMISATGRSSSLCDYSPGRPPLGLIRARQSDLGVHPPVPPITRSVSNDEGSVSRAGPSFFIGGALLDANAIVPDSWVSTAVTGEHPLGSHSPSPSGQDSVASVPVSAGSQPEPTVGDSTKRRPHSSAPPLQSSTNLSVTGNLAPEGGGSTSPDFVSRGSSSEQKTSSMGPLPHTVRRKSGDDKSPLNLDSELKPTTNPDSTSEHIQPTSDKIAQITDTVDGPKDEEAINEEEEKEDEDDEDENDDEDEDDEDDEKNLSETIDRFEPQTIHVVAPDRAPNHPALFTHCQYFYIGSGRWQVYVQMWFVEERLKRETYVQVFDYEWHDYERVADLFEASRCLNPVDRPSLVRLLALARHNCPLIDGELQFPGPLNVRSSHFDAFELHEKLTALRLHQQARDQLLRECAAQESRVLPDGTQIQSLCASDPDAKQPSSLPPERDTKGTLANTERQESDNLPTVPDEVPACADHVFQLQEQQRSQLQPAKETELTKEPIHVLLGGSRKRLEVPSANNTLFLDVGSLAPRNAYCALCDTHDYLHRVDLPAYLISPCYHCREGLAKEAKISPEVLLDLHLQHNIPWPAHLQARFNLPTDGRSMEELIAYDCRWRSRQPCRCLVPMGGHLLPPCVEFPWLCPPASAVSSNGSSVSAVSGNPVTAELIKHSAPVADLPPTPDTPVSTSSAENRPKLSETRSGSPVHAAVHPNESTVSMPAVPITLGAYRGQQFPCSGRHPRGAPTTCCHGIQFPRLDVTGAPAPNRTPPTTIPESCQAATIVTETPVTNPGGSTHPGASSLLPNGFVS